MRTLVVCLALLVASCGRASFDDRELSLCWPNCELALGRPEVLTIGRVPLTVGVVDHLAVTEVGGNVAMAYNVTQDGVEHVMSVLLDSNAMPLTQPFDLGVGTYPSIASDGTSIAVGYGVLKEVLDINLALYDGSATLTSSVQVESGALSWRAYVAHGAGAWGIGWSGAEGIGDFARYDAGATIIGTRNQVSNPGGDCYCSPSAAWSGNVWAFAFVNHGVTQSTLGYDAILVRGTPDGARLGDDIALSDSGSATVAQAIWSGAGFDVTWLAGGGDPLQIAHARVDEDGTIIQPAQQLGTIAASVGDSGIGPSLMTAIDGTTIIAWRDTAGLKVVWLDENGAPLGDAPLNLASSTITSEPAAVAIDGQTVLIFWGTSDAGLQFARVTRQ
jgi:hypothetical protein